MQIEGRDERVFVALSRPPLVAGVDPKLLMGNFGFVVFVLVLFRDMTIVAGFAALAVVLHFFLKSLYRSDPWLRPIYVRYMRQSDRYEPWPEKSPKRSLRPIGFGRGSL